MSCVVAACFDTTIRFDEDAHCHADGRPARRSTLRDMPTVCAAQWTQTMDVVPPLGAVVPASIELERRGPRRRHCKQIIAFVCHHCTMSHSWSAKSHCPLSPILSIHVPPPGKISTPKVVNKLVIFPQSHGSTPLGECSCCAVQSPPAGHDFDLP